MKNNLIKQLNQISNAMDSQWIKLDYLTKKFLKNGYYFTYVCDDKCVIIDTFNNDNTIYLNDEKLKDCLKGDSNE